MLEPPSLLHNTKTCLCNLVLFNWSSGQRLVVDVIIKSLLQSRSLCQDSPLKETKKADRGNFFALAALFEEPLVDFQDASFEKKQQKWFSASSFLQKLPRHCAYAHFQPKAQVFKKFVQSRKQMSSSTESTQL